MVQEEQCLLCRGWPPNSWGGREGPPGRMPPLKRQQDYYALFGVRAAEAAHGRGMPGGVEVAAVVAVDQTLNKTQETRHEETRLKNGK